MDDKKWPVGILVNEDALAQLRKDAALGALVR